MTEHDNPTDNTSADMSKEDASRIQSAADRDPDSDSATSRFAQRAQSAADRGHSRN